MATKHYIPDLMPEDLEDTADYPPVSVPAPASVSTTATIQEQVADTWVMPKLDEAQPPAAATAPAEPVAAAKPAPVPEDLLRPYVEENSKLRAELSAASIDRDELQQQLEQRTAANRELERRLQVEAERLTQLQGEAAQFERRGTELAAELEARTAQWRTADAERAELHARFESAQAELTAQAQQRERLVASQSEAERERAHRETALVRSQEELTELHRRVAGHCEALRAVEGQRQLYDSMLREREDMIDQADARARAAEARAQEAERLRKPEPDPELPRRIAALEAQLEESRAEARTLAEQLRSEQESAAAMRTELEARSVARTEVVDGPAPEQTLVPAPEPAPDPGHTAVPVPEVTRLLVRTSGDTGIVHKLGRRTAIGRTPDNDLRIDEDFISRRHAVILASAENAIVEDLNSTNGVFVNGVQVTRRELREGDLLTIGKTSFRYVLKPATGQE
jgi:hypothetical protein